MTDERGHPGPNGTWIDPHMLAAIERYTVQRIKPGSFLQAVICNDLQRAVGLADEENMHNLPAFCHYFYFEAPSKCWGSPEKMDAWLKGAK
jgi:hypothetical protein